MQFLDRDGKGDRADPARQQGDARQGPGSYPEPVN